MTVKERTTVRLYKNIREEIEIKCPTVNLSRLLNNVLEYILQQDQEIINEFATKKPIKI